MQHNADPLLKLTAYIRKGDTGIICSYRKKFPEGIAYTSREHQQRNRSLLAKLLADGFTVTLVEGWCNETGGAEQDEYLFLVRDDLKKGVLESRLRQYAEQFEQDSVLFIPNGGLVSLLIGTKPGTPNYGVRERLPILGKDAEVLRQGPFYFGERILGNHHCGNLMGRWAASADARKHWSKLVLPEDSEGTQKKQK